MNKLWLGAITLFPEMFESLQSGIPGRAINNGLVHFERWNPRDYTQDKHRTVDDKPFGGGPGMVMKPEPLVAAIKDAKQQAPAGTKVVYLSPQGERFTQKKAIEASQMPGILFVAGRYEGIDQRVIDTAIDEEWSLGDFVMTGGELAAMAMIDSIVRLLPGCLGDDTSSVEESFMQGQLDYPHYTRPEDFEGHKVPKVLLSGDHGAIKKWRQGAALLQTWLKRPDLLAIKALSPEETALLDELKRTLGE